MNADLLIQNGHVVDPLNNVDGTADVAVVGGRVAAVGRGLDPDGARQIINADGLLVTPGIIDPHTHLVDPASGGVPYAMALREGYTTAMDMRGSIDTFAEEMKVHGCGLNAACLHGLTVGPEGDLGSVNAGREEIAAAVDRALAKGALGVKVLGSAFPLSPDTTALVFEECDKRGAYVSIHAATTEHNSTILAFEQIVGLTHGHPLHIAHVNGYCRGQVEHELIEAARVVKALEDNPHIVSESYLSSLNAANAAVDGDDQVISPIAKGSLVRKGYGTDRKGMAQALKDGWGTVYARLGGEMVYMAPADGYALWEKCDTKVWCSFPMNPASSLVACATARRKDGSFVVDAFSTDGGSIPRNVIMTNGLRLVQMRYLSLPDLIRKASLGPARLLGLTGKGHLTPGADADISIFDPKTTEARYAVVNGVVRMAGGICLEGPGTVITTEEGKKHIEKQGLPLAVTDLGVSLFRQGH